MRENIGSIKLNHRVWLATKYELYFKSKNELLILMLEGPYCNGCDRNREICLMKRFLIVLDLMDMGKNNWKWKQIIVWKRKETKK